MILITQFADFSHAANHQRLIQFEHPPTKLLRKGHKMTTSNFQVTNLKCEYRRNPLGIDVSQPRLSWQLDAPQRGAAQWAFQVVASLDKESLFRGDSVLWDSGRIETDQSIHIPYAGPTLQSRQRIYWRVRIWDENNQPSAWSETAWFEMGFLDEVDWQGQWIVTLKRKAEDRPVPSPGYGLGGPRSVLCFARFGFAGWRTVGSGREPPSPSRPQ